MRNRDVNATALNDQVHCGWDSADRSDEENNAVSWYGEWTGPKTDIAHPTSAPLYPQRPFLRVASSSPAIFDAAFEVNAPRAANDASFGLEKDEKAASAVDNHRRRWCGGIDVSWRLWRWGKAAPR